ncbi:efflux RND transporter periplasmic adaptor subunit [Dokdonella sp.]|uniref:efflux RND transporter periplasmic adaptor subunit n=1 Tax=Dokdonella sp. TaxID=2291710 RepID=UPI00352859E9
MAAFPLNGMRMMSPARLRPIHWIALAALVALLTLAAWLLRGSGSVESAHESKLPEADAQAHIQLSVTQRDALGIELIDAVAAESVPVTGLPAEVLAPLASSTQVTVPYSGVVTRILVDEGEQVSEAQPMLRLRSRDLIEARGDLARARAETTAAVEKANRDTTLAQEGIISASRRNDSVARARAARASLAEAQEMLSQLRMAADGLPGEYEVLAPRAGQVLRRLVAPGEALQAMAPAFVIAATDELDIVFSVPVNLRAELRTGLSIVLPNGAMGQVVAIGADIESTTQSLRVRARTAAPGALVVGQQIEASLLLPAPPEALIVPVSALLSHGPREVLYVEEDNGFRGIVVDHLGGDLDSAVVRGAGLTAGMRVVARGASVLKTLAPVQE